MNEKQKDYYEQKTKDLPVHIEHNENYGKHARTEVDLEEEELIFREVPMVSIQYSPSKYEVLACSYCCKFIGTLEDQIEHLTNLKVKLPFTEECFSGTNVLSDIICCRNKNCQEKYCSKECEEQGFNEYHELLCTKLNEKNEIFEEHAMATNDTFRLAARIVANITQNMKNNHISFEEAYFPYNNCMKKEWYKLAAKDEQERMEIKYAIQESLDILKEICFLENFEELFTIDVYSCIIGILEMNSLEITVDSPLARYFYNISDILDEEDFELALEIIRPITLALEENSGGYDSERSEDEEELYPRFSGVGLYAIQSTMNHSCCPNARAFKTEEDTNNCVSIISEEKIEKGEQLFISYIDENQSFEERQEELTQSYLFNCTCPKCENRI